VPRFHNGIVEAFVTAVRVVALFATVVGLHYYSVGLCGHIAGPPDLAMDSSGDMVQQRIQGNSQSGLGIDSLYMFSIARRQIFASLSYLFTFCPPGPDDLLKLNSPMLFKGIASACRVASHERATRRSSSLAWLVLSLADDRQRCTTGEHLVIRTGGRVGKRQRRSMARQGEIMHGRPSGNAQPCHLSHSRLD
jgi:hypothetical protein